MPDLPLMVAGEQEPSRMRHADKRLLAPVLRWARTNGWRQSRFDIAGDREFTSADELLTVVIEPAEDGTVEVTVFEVGALRYRGWPKTVTQSFDVLVALGVIPVEFSSLFAGVKVQWGTRRDGYRSVRVTSEDRARHDFRAERGGRELLRRRVVEGQWELVEYATDGHKPWMPARSEVAL